MHYGTHLTHCITARFIIISLYDPHCVLLYLIPTLRDVSRTGYRCAPPRSEYNCSYICQALGTSFQRSHKSHSSSIYQICIRQCFWAYVVGRHKPDCTGSRTSTTDSGICKERSRRGASVPYTDFGCCNAVFLINAHGHATGPVWTPGQHFIRRFRGHPIYSVFNPRTPGYRRT
jgi:hypothetical protein